MERTLQRAVNLLRSMPFAGCPVVYHSREWDQQHRLLVDLLMMLARFFTSSFCH